METNAERLAAEIFLLATGRKRQLAAIQEIGDRCEGRPATAVGPDGTVDPFAQLLVLMAAYNPYGPPEKQEALDVESKEIAEIV